MAGRVKRLINELIELRTAGNGAVAYFVRAQLAIKGINIEAYHEGSPDDPEVQATLEDMIDQFRSPAARRSR